MSCKTETQVIQEIDDDGNEIAVEYSCTQYPALTGALYKIKIIEMFGASLAKIVPAMQSKDLQQVDALGDGLNTLFKSSSPEKIINLISEMITTGSVSRNGTKIIGKSKIDEFYSGDNLGALYRVFIFVVKVNYAGFFKGKKAQAILAKAEASL